LKASYLVIITYAVNAQTYLRSETGLKIAMVAE